MNCLTAGSGTPISTSSSLRRRSNSMSHKIHQFFHRSHRRRFTERSSRVLQDKNISFDLEMRPQTAPNRCYEVEDEDFEEADYAVEDEKVNETRLTDAEMKAYLIGEHEKNMRVRLRGTKAKIEVDHDKSASGSGMSSSGYDSSWSSYGVNFPTDKEEKDNGQKIRSMERWSASSPDERGKKESGPPMLKRKGNFRLERRVSELERAETSSGDNMGILEEPQTSLRPIPAFRVPIMSTDMSEGAKKNSYYGFESPKKLRTSIRSASLHQLPSFDFPSKSLQAFPPTPKDIQPVSLIQPRPRKTKPILSSNKISQHLNTSPAPTDTRLTPPKWLSSHHKQSNSSSSKISSYIGSSADLLDATRRDIQSSLRKNADAISGILPLDWREKIIDDDTDSDESFYCIGEKYEKRLSTLGHERRLSGKGEDLWTGRTIQVCRMCKNASSAGLRGLCNDCKVEFRRQRTRVAVARDGKQEQVKFGPPLPLKFRNPISPLSPANPRVSTLSTDSVLEAQLVGMIRRSAQSVQISTRTNGHPNVVAINAYVSQLGADQDIRQRPESRTAFERWQSTEVRDAYKRREKTDQQWSPSLLGELTPRTVTPVTSRFGERQITPDTSTCTSKPSELLFTPGTSKDSENNVIDEDVKELMPRIVEKKIRKGKGLDRSDSFYGFYDDILNDSEESATLSAWGKLQFR